jgi:hypothetical protein
MPFSRQTLTLISEAVGYLARSEGPLLGRLLYVDNLWLATIQPADLDNDLLDHLNEFHQILQWDTSTQELQQAADTLVLILVQYSARRPPTQPL